MPARLLACLVLALTAAGAALAQGRPVSQEQFGALATVVAVGWWAVTYGLIFFMQSGFMLLEAGSVRAKNAAHIATKVLSHIGITIAVFYGLGFSIKAFGWPLAFVLRQWSTHVPLAQVSDPVTMYAGWSKAGGGLWPWAFAATPDTYVWAFFGSLMFCLTSMAIPGTVFSERFSFRAYLLFSVAYAGIIYPVFGWLIWGGMAGSPLLDPHSPLVLWLDRLFTPEVGSALGRRLLAYGMVPDASGRHFYAPYTDYAGSTGVHVLGGLTGLVGAVYVGARRGRFVDGRPRPLPGHNVPMAVLGALLLAFCWYGFNAGSVMANYFNSPAGLGAGPRGLYLADFLYSDVWWVVVVTTLAASGGVLGSLLGNARFGKPDPLVIANGLLGGLVAVCAGVGFVHPWWGFAIGLVAGLQFPFTARLVERLGIDDAIGTIPCHTVSGLLGGLMAGIWGQLFWSGRLPLSWVHPGATALGGSFIPTFAMQVAGLVFLVAWALPAGLVTFRLIDRLVGCRVSAREEEEGLDLALHGVKAYPADSVGFELSLLAAPAPAPDRRLS